jgi:hypothetical protein
MLHRIARLATDIHVLSSATDQRDAGGCLGRSDFRPFWLTWLSRDNIVTQTLQIWTELLQKYFR